MKGIGILVAVLLWVGLAAADNYFPLQIGSTWNYVGAQGGVAKARVVGTQAILGVDTVVREWVRYSATASESLANYWSMNSEGDVFLHGFTRYSDGLQLVYDPPVLFLDAPLSTGKTWQTTGVVYTDFAGATPSGDTLTVGYEVSSEGDRTVPAGAWFGYAVREVLFSVRHESDLVTAAGSSSPLGNDSVFEDWFVDGVGEIEIQTNEVFKLESRSLPPTAIEEISWTSIKALYR